MSLLNQLLRKQAEKHKEFKLLIKVFGQPNYGKKLSCHFLCTELNISQLQTALRFDPVLKDVKY